jgi:hypothetical protein
MKKPKNVILGDNKDNAPIFNDVMYHQDVYCNPIQLCIQDVKVHVILGMGMMFWFSSMMILAFIIAFMGMMMFPWRFQLICI